MVHGSIYMVKHGEQIVILIVKYINAIMNIDSCIEEVFARAFPLSEVYVCTAP